MNTKRVPFLTRIYLKLHQSSRSKRFNPQPCANNARRIKACLKGLVAVRVNFDCIEVFYWIQRGRKPRSPNSENRNIKDPPWHVSTSLSGIFIPSFLDTRWSQRDITFTNVFNEPVKSALWRPIFCLTLYLRFGICALIPPKYIIAPEWYFWNEK